MENGKWYIFLHNLPELQERRQLEEMRIISRENTCIDINPVVCFTYLEFKYPSGAFAPSLSMLTTESMYGGNCL